MVDDFKYVDDVEAAEALFAQADILLNNIQKGLAAHSKDVMTHIDQLPGISSDLHYAASALVSLSVDPADYDDYINFLMRGADLLTGCGIDEGVAVLEKIQEKQRRVRFAQSVMIGNLEMIEKHSDR